MEIVKIRELSKRLEEKRRKLVGTDSRKLWELLKDGGSYAGTDDTDGDAKRDQLFNKGSWPIDRECGFDEEPDASGRAEIIDLRSWKKEETT